MSKLEKSATYYEVRITKQQWKPVLHILYYHMPFSNDLFILTIQTIYQASIEIWRHEREEKWA